MRKELLNKIIKELGLDKEAKEAFLKDVDNNNADMWLRDIADLENISNKEFQEFEESISELPLTKEAYKVLYSNSINVSLYNYEKDDETGELIAYEVEIEHYSGLGEDIVETIELPAYFTNKDLKEAFAEIYRDFDVDEHVKKNLYTSYSIRDLLEDAEDTENFYYNVMNDLGEI